MKSLTSNIAAVALVLTTLSVTVWAEPTPAARSSASNAVELEKAFWVCDHAATTQGVDLNVAATCGAVTDELRRARFGGDFKKMLQWWRLNKVAQHAALDRDDAARAGSDSADMVVHRDSI